MIIFNYPISDITSNAQVLSIYRAGSQLEKGSDNMVDDSAVSDEDESLLKKYLKSGCALIANVLSGYTKDLRDKEFNLIPMEGEPFEFDVTYDAVEHNIVFRINMPDTFPAKSIILIDDSIKDALENYVLYRVSKLKLIEGESYFSDWDTQLGNIRTYIHRRTEGIKRNYKFL